MSQKLVLFEFFHKLKNFTTASYSAKKLQDMLENELNSEGEFEDLLIGQWVQEWGKISKDLDRSMEELNNFSKDILKEK